MRVRLAGAFEALGGEIGEAELGGIELRVLAGQDQPRGSAETGERMGDGSKLDGFGPGADHQSDIYAVQSSP
jgi:hypothetical protein